MANKVITKNSDVITITMNDHAETCVEKCQVMSFKNSRVLHIKQLLDDRVQMKVDGENICLSMDCVDTVEGSTPTDADDLYDKILDLL